jgi:hypothetical protein
MGAKADRTKGRLEEGVGGLTDNKRLKDEGRADSAAGYRERGGGPRYRRGQAGARLDMQRVRVEVVDPGSHFTRVRPRSSRDDPGGCLDHLAFLDASAPGAGLAVEILRDRG